MAAVATAQVDETTLVKQQPNLHIRDVVEDLPICEANIHGACSLGQSCDYHHCLLPYLWQILIPESGWQNLIEHSEEIENMFCQPQNLYYQTEIPATAPDGTSFPMIVELDFVHMKARLRSHILPPEGLIVDARRLSTPSYAKFLETQGTDVIGAKYNTQWRWWWCSGDNQWKSFGEDESTPMQYVLENKYLAGQEVFRFEMKRQKSGSNNTRTDKIIFLLEYYKMCLRCLNDRSSWIVNRRPLFVDKTTVTPGAVLESPPCRPCSLLPMLPENWYPIDPKQDYELVPLNPDSMAFHLVASEFHSSVPQRKKILDVFRVQNPFFWNQFKLKKTLMESRGKNPKERQLFHGTSEESAVEAICRDNFDWRVCGKNNIVYGCGTYFAVNSALSDKYAASHRMVRWMFLARVLVGKYTRGISEMKRPPPLDAAYPHGDLYDSCVDNVSAPSLFVIFEKDQCYPEYLIGYS